MSRIARVTQAIFGSSASDIGQFGSAQLGTKVLTSDLATIQALPAWAGGWLDAIIGANKFPPIEEVNAIDYLVTTQLAYLFQMGIAEYDAGTTYYHYSICLKAGTFQIYGSLTDNNVGNALTSGTNWKMLVDLNTIGPALLPANNLSDVANEATALSNLGGLAKASNLSDLGSLATALANLGFGGNSTTYLEIPNQNDPTKPWIVQLGTVSGGASANNAGFYEFYPNITFPIAFPNACLKVITSAISTANICEYASHASISQSGFTGTAGAYGNTTNTYGLDWIAIGN